MGGKEGFTDAVGCKDGKTEKAEIDSMIYSPVEQIPLGVPVLTDEGKLALRVKYTTKKNKHKTEDVPLEYVVAKAIHVSAVSRDPPMCRNPRADEQADP